MRRHRHHLKPEQRPKLAAYFEQFPVLREIYRFKQRLCYLLLKKPAPSPGPHPRFWRTLVGRAMMIRC